MIVRCLLEILVRRNQTYECGLFSASVECKASFEASTFTADAPVRLKVFLRYVLGCALS